MEIEFRLSGLGDVTLERKVYEAVKCTGYSDKELSDIREPARYNIFDLLCDLDKIKQKLSELQQIASLMPNIVIPHSITNIKTLFKKIFAKFVKWYIVPMAESQSNINNKTLMLISELVFSMQTQKEAIIRMQEELDTMRGKNV